MLCPRETHLVKLRSIYMSREVSRDRVKTWLAFLDIIISEIEQRFANDSFKPIICVENLLMLVSRGLTFDEKLKEVLQFYNDYMTKIFYMHNLQYWRAKK